MAFCLLRRLKHGTKKVRKVIETEAEIKNINVMWVGIKQIFKHQHWYKSIEKKSKLLFYGALFSLAISVSNIN